MYRTVEIVDSIRRAVGDVMDIMVDAHGPPWFTTKDAIIVGKGLEPLQPIVLRRHGSAGEYSSASPCPRERRYPDSSRRTTLPHLGRYARSSKTRLSMSCNPIRVGSAGSRNSRKIAALAEAHYINVAPHSGSLGPVAEYAALHILASIANALILERLEDDVPQRYEVIQPHLPTVDGYITVPEEPGLGVDFDEDVVAANPPDPNVYSGPDPARRALRAGNIRRTRLLSAALPQAARTQTTSLT